MSAESTEQPWPATSAPVGQKPRATNPASTTPGAVEGFIGVELEWKPNGNAGNGTMLIRLPDGPFTESLKIVSEAARAKVVKKLEGRLGEQELDDLREQLEKLAADTATEMSSGDGGSSEKDADKLIRLVLDDDAVELFRAPGDMGIGYATVKVDQRRETYKIGGESFRLWISKRYFDEYEGAVGGQAMTDATQLLTSRAVHNGPTIRVETRIAFSGGDIVVDLGDENRNVVIVSRDGWRVEPSSNVATRFIRRNGMLPLPYPVPGGSVDTLRVCVNVPDDNAWKLVVGALVAYLYPRGPFPVLVISGEQGSAKSSLAKMLQRLVDPNKAELRRPPKSEEDLLIAASNTWLLAYDNLSGIKPDLSDAICTLATGGGFATRRLYSNDEEAIFQAQRPVMLNGIDDLTQRADLLDRSVVLNLTAIDETIRRAEDEVWASFEECAPGVFGALLDALIGVLRGREFIQLDRAPRMADFAKTVCAAEQALGWTQGAFLSAYDENRGLAAALAIEDSVVGQCVLRMMATETEWTGTSTELRTELVKHLADATTVTAKSFPSPTVIGKELRRVAPALRRVGVSVEAGDRANNRGRARLNTLRRVSVGGPSPADPGEGQAGDESGNGLGAALQPGSPGQSLDSMDRLDRSSPNLFVEKLLREGGDTLAPKDGDSAAPGSSRNSCPTRPTCPKATVQLDQESRNPGASAHQEGLAEDAHGEADRAFAEPGGDDQAQTCPLADSSIAGRLASAPTTVPLDEDELPWELLLGTSSRLSTVDDGGAS